MRGKYTIDAAFPSEREKKLLVNVAKLLHSELIYNENQ